MLVYKGASIDISEMYTSGCRYHKPLVLDLLDVDSLSLLEHRLAAVQPKLLEAILTKNIMKESW